MTTIDARSGSGDLSRNAEDIVRALAALDHPTDYDPQCCCLCQAHLEWSADDPEPTVEMHEPSCPWRRAREWVVFADEIDMISGWIRDRFEQLRNLPPNL